MALTKAYQITIDGKQATATVGQLKEEIERLEAQLELTATGSAEAEAALMKLGKAKGALKELEDAVDSIADVKNRAAAFTDFANGIVGAASIASASLQGLGLSADSAAEAEAKLQGLLTTMSALEAISQATSSETMGVVKATYQQAKAWLTAGNAATTSGKMTRLALASTGIGLIVLAVALLASNWDKVTASVKGSEQFFVKVKATVSGFFDGVLAYLKNLGAVAEKVWDGDFSGAIAKARTVGREVGAAYQQGYTESVAESAADAERAMVQLQIEAREREIAELKAKGAETFKLEEKNLQERIRIQKRGTAEEKKEYEDLRSQLRQLRIATNKKEREEQQAADMARLNARIQLEEAKGNETGKRRLRALQKQLSIELSAVDRNEAKIADLRGQIDALLLQNQLAAYDQRRKALENEGQQAAALAQAEGQQTLGIRLRTAEQLLALDKQTLAGQLANSQRLLEQRAADERAYELLLAERTAAERQAEEQAQEGRVENRDILRKLDEETAANFKKGVAEGAQQAKAAVKQFNFGESLLAKVFGVTPDQMEATTQAVNFAVATIGQTLSGIATSLLSASLEAVNAQIDTTKTKLDEIDRQLQERSKAASAAEAALAQASGAKRDYLLGKIRAERAEEQRLRTEKAAAARELEKQEKEKHRLEVIGQRLSAASALASNASTAAKATEAAVTAIKNSAAFPPPASFALITASIAAIAAAVLSAKQLGNTFKMANGGVLKDWGIIQGGSHASGNDVPVFGGRVRVEGGEHITPVDATNNNLPYLELIRTQGRQRRLQLADFARVTSGMQVLPPPAPIVGGRYADGGRLPMPAAGSVISNGEARLVAVEEQLRITNGLLAQVVQHTGAVAAYGPPVVPIGDQEVDKIYTRGRERRFGQERGARLATL